MARFTLPRDLYHGKGAMEALKTFKGKKMPGHMGNKHCTVLNMKVDLNKKMNE